MKPKLIMCTDGVQRTEKQYDEWLYNLQELAMNEPKDLTDAEFKALEKEGLIY